MLTCYVFCQDEMMVTQETYLPQLESLILRQIHQTNKFIALELTAKPKLNSHPFLPLKQAMNRLTETQLLEAIQAHFILRWDKIHQYCGACGNQTIHRPPAFERYCKTCALSFFPRISPCIIVAIHKGKQLLMARSPHFAPGVYGLIAGFIEAGETVEQAVHREVMEETGLKIKNLRYYGSQPWPFPDALMLGFQAEYAEGELKTNQEELEDAGWFDYNQLPGRPSHPQSMASQLIDDFIHQQTN